MPLKASSKMAGPTPTKRRNSTLWSETLDVHQKSTFSTKEIKRQEVVHFFLSRVRVTLQNRNGNLSGWPLFLFQAIHELYRGEQDLIEDLQLARKVRTCCFFPQIFNEIWIFILMLPLLLSQLQGVPWSDAQALHHDKGRTSSHIWRPGCIHPPTRGYFTFWA